MPTVSNLPKLYEEKENLKVDNSIPENKKVTANDMNTIKKLLENSCFLDPNVSSDKLIGYNARALNPIISRYERKVSVDSNGWTVAEYYDHKEYFKKGTYEITNFPANTWGHYQITPLPTGMTEIGNCILTSSIVASDGAFCASCGNGNSRIIMQLYNAYNGAVSKATVNWDLRIIEQKQNADIPDTEEEIKNYVKFNDYATETKAGVVKLGNGLSLDSNGKSKCDVNTYDEYTVLSDDTFISKGTLADVLENEIGSISDTLNSINGEVV